MAVYQPISIWITYAKAYQFYIGGVNEKKKIFQGGALVPDYEQVLRWVRKSVEWAYGQNPNDITLNATSTYMISLVDQAKAIIIVSGTGGCIPPTITQNPNSQTIASGGTATFSVLATGTGTLSYQWQLNLSNIIGANSASYTTPSVTTGGAYRCIVSNACGTVSSGTATLTVNAPAINFVIGWSATDPYTNDSTPLTITNAQTISYSPGGQVVFNGSLAPFANMYVMWGIVSTEPVPTSWKNSVLNQGIIPDITIRTPFIIGGTMWVACRNPMSLDTTQNLSLNH